MTGGNQAIAYREIMDIKTAANYLGVSRSHLAHILAGKIPGVPVIPHIRAGRRALIRRAVIDRRKTRTALSRTRLGLRNDQGYG